MHVIVRLNHLMKLRDNYELDVGYIFMELEHMDSGL